MMIRFNDLEANLKTGVKPVYYLKGDDWFLLSEAARMIKSACNISMEDFNSLTLDNEFFKVSDVLSACLQYPSFDEKKFILVNNVSSTINEEDKNAFLNYLKNPFSSSVLVIKAFADNENFAFVSGYAEVVDCRKLELYSAVKMIIAEANKFKKQIGEKAAGDLARLCAFDMAKIKNEINKLAFYDLEQKEITAEMIEEQVSEIKDYQVFELSDAIANKNADKTYDMLAGMLSEKKDSAFFALSLISNHFRRLLYANTSTMKDGEVASLLGVKEYSITKARQQKNKFSPKILKKIVDRCCDIEYQVKSGQISSVNGINILIAELLN